MCSHFCPAGNWTEFGSKLIPGRFKIDYGKIFDTPLFRYGFLGAYILLPVVGVSSICCSFCSFSVIPEFFGMFFTPQLAAMLGSGTRLISVVLFVFLLGIFSRDGRGHCHLICPVGALDSIVNTLGAKLPFTLRERVTQSKCTACGHCATNCPISAITVDKEAEVKTKIDYRRCYQCRECEANCPTNAIYYGKLIKEEDILYDPKIKQIPVLD
jgi:ferredoxin